MVVKTLRSVGGGTLAFPVLPMDTLLMVRSIFHWLHFRFFSGGVCACVSAFLLLYGCSVCKVRNEKWQTVSEH